MVDELADLDPVGADVLDRRRADRARNQDQVLEPAETAPQRPAHEIVPVFAGLDADQGARAVVFAHLDAERRDRQHDAGPVAREQDVAALAEDQQRIGLEHGEAEQFAQGLAPAHIDQQPRSCRHAERVATLERGIFDDGVADALGDRRVDVIAPLIHAEEPAGSARMASTLSLIRPGPR